ncbi:MAG: VOC family protein [Lachnospiraceae bacterium]|jgi:lactoylglutathione lyase
MKLLSIDHITINLLKIEESIRFYEDVIGLSKIEDIDMGDHILHLYQLPGAKLELIEYKGEQKIVQTGNTDIGVYRHFAVKVEDLEAASKEIEAAGYGVNLPISFIPQLNTSIMLIKDPNGVEIELVQA